MRKIKSLSLVLIAGLLISVMLTGGCYPTDEQASGEFDWTMILIVAFIGAAMYFLMIRPQRKKQQEHQKLVEELKRGDRVITAGGIYGQIESLSEDSLVIKVESGATMRVARNSVTLKREK